ncbi:hypothetical protein ScPMuIL_005563 [Solemya velum]
MRRIALKDLSAVVDAGGMFKHCLSSRCRKEGTSKTTMIFLLIATGILTVALYKLFQFVQRYRELHAALNQIPGANGHWLMGQVNEMGTVMDYYSLLTKYVEENGRMCRVWFTQAIGIVSTFHPETMKLFLRSNDPKPNTPLDYKYLVPWLGQGLVISNGEKWDRDRKLLTPAFHFNTLKPYTKIFNETVDDLLNNLQKLSAGGESVEVYRLASAATLESMLLCALSYKSGIQNMKAGEKHPYVEAVSQIADVVMYRALNIHLFSDFIFNLTSKGRETKKNLDFVHRFAEEIIAQRRMKLAESKEVASHRNLDFLDILLTAKDDEGKGLTDEEIREQVDTFMFAGHDTTATATSWFLYALGQHPDLQEEVYQEVKLVLGDRKYVEGDDLPKLKKLTYFLKESMRMYPTVPSVIRQTARPTEVDGIMIPKGVLIDINVYSLHHNPHVWENPWEFDPTRFDTDLHPNRDPYSFIPFVAGPRNCIGQNFAMNEVKIFFARIIQRFRVVEAPEHKVTLAADLVLRSSTGIWVKLASRD